MLRWYLTCLIVVATSAAHGRKLDDIAGLNTQQTSQLEHFILVSIGRLKEQANSTGYLPLEQYADQLQQLLKPACPHCTDYFEAVAHLRTLGIIVTNLLTDDKEVVHWPVIRRSYIAAVWLLQRSKLFSWKYTHMGSSTANIMYRLYLKHVQRAQGRTINFHHVSKCGGTTMCQLAAANKCSNPHLDMEKNCVIDDRLDSPVWMVSHFVNNSGVYPDRVAGVLDTEPQSPVTPDYNRHEFATEPPLDMWLMYACPYQRNGRAFGCRGRQSLVDMTGTTFMANERALSIESGQSQVCPNFINAIILREPVPQVISLMAEVRFRYERQLALKNITSWQPPAWNLTWWETLGPALVGSYATRSLVGRQSFCRSANNTNNSDLSRAVKSLLSFDMVMTLRRAKDIDLLVSNMLGWTARNFSTQPATRVRNTVIVPKALNFFGTRSLLEVQSQSSSARSSDDLAEAVAELAPLTMAVRTLRLQNWTLAGVPKARSLFAAAIRSSDNDLTTAGEVWPAAASNAVGLQHLRTLKGRHIAIDAPVMEATQDDSGIEDSEEPDDDTYGQEDEGDEDEAAFGVGRPTQAPLPPEVIDIQNAIRLVRSSHLQRQAEQHGFSNTSAASQVPRQPEVTYLGQLSQHGAHLVQTMLDQSIEVWHAFPRHNITLTASDMTRLESFTRYDAQLFELADTMLNLDVAWLRHLLQHHQYRKKVSALADTYTACGFAGILPRKKVKHRHPLL